MDKLTKSELEEYWQIAFGEMDADTCFAIDSFYQQKFGMVAWHSFVVSSNYNLLTFCGL